MHLCDISIRSASCLLLTKVFASPDPQQWQRFIDRKLPPPRIWCNVTWSLLGALSHSGIMTSSLCGNWNGAPPPPAAITVPVSSVRGYSVENKSDRYNSRGKSYFRLLEQSNGDCFFLFILDYFWSRLKWDGNKSFTINVPLNNDS